MKCEQVRHGGMSVLVLEILVFFRVQPITISLVRLQLDFENAGFLVRIILWFFHVFRRGVFPNITPTPRLIHHFLAERDLDFGHAGSNSGRARFGEWFISEKRREAEE